MMPLSSGNPQFAKPYAVGLIRITDDYTDFRAGGRVTHLTSNLSRYRLNRLVDAVAPPRRYAMACACAQHADQGKAGHPPSDFIARFAAESAWLSSVTWLG